MLVYVPSYPALPPPRLPPSAERRGGRVLLGAACGPPAVTRSCFTRRGLRPACGHTVVFYSARPAARLRSHGRVLLGAACGPPAVTRSCFTRRGLRPACGHTVVFYSARPAARLRSPLRKPRPLGVVVSRRAVGTDMTSAFPAERAVALEQVGPLGEVFANELDQLAGIDSLPSRRRGDHRRGRN